MPKPSLTKVHFLLGKLEKPPKTCTLIGFAFFSEIQHVRDSKYGFVLQEGIPSAYWKVCMQSLHNLYNYVVVNFIAGNFSFSFVFGYGN